MTAREPLTITQPFSIAPMMDWTDRHYRYFVQGLTKHALLYTEMIPQGVLIYGPRIQALQFSPQEKPLAIQLDGSCPKQLAECAIYSEEACFEKINLNAGCPSKTVQAGRFGGCLMKELNLVAACIESMQKATHLPISIKCRIGVDEHDTYSAFSQFVRQLSEKECQKWIVHARKAWLSGLNSKQNLNIPPLCYEYVYQLKHDFPNLHVPLNGVIQTLEEAQKFHWKK